MDRRAFLFSSMVFASGCTGMAVRSQSPETALEELDVSTRLVGDVAATYGMEPMGIEAIGLVSGLPNTGSDPAPSPQRASLLAEMQTRGVINPNQVLASPTTEMVLVRGVLRPGIQKGDRFDIEVRVPSRSECTSLRDGWLMETRLREMAVLEGQVREGNAMALASGAVLVEPGARSEDKVAQCRGRVLGGGVSLVSRELGLVLKTDERSVLVSAQVGNAINRRMHTYDAGLKQGVAKPKTDEFVGLRVHPRYKDNIDRYMRVVRSIPLRETAQQQMQRTQLLERQLLDPISAGAAAVRLEALGKEATPVLVKGLEARDAEVRFYASEALAYLDDGRAAPVLGQLARDYPAFRAFCLTALSAMDDFAAYDALRELLSVASAETRYGAFRALWAMNQRDPLVKGEKLGDQFGYHVLDVGGGPLVHVTRSYRPEVVLFGKDQRFKTPFVLEAGRKIIVTARDVVAEEVVVARVASEQPDQKRTVSTRIDDVIRAIVELGGTYPDVVQVLQEAKAKNALPGRFEIDAIPQGGRTFYRDESPEGSQLQTPEVVVANPIPELFGRPSAAGTTPARESAPPTESKSAEEEGSSQPVRSFFGKIWGRSRAS